ncbi:MAG: hypothetical protein JST49_01795 [Bacteroidetes bacterium]|nr:hypothetical protein [Bacteroidota bacterium]
MKKIALTLIMLVSVAIGYSQQEASSSRTAPKQAATTTAPVRNERPATTDPNAAKAARKVEAAPTNSNTTIPTREAVNDPNAATNKRTAPKE